MSDLGEGRLVGIDVEEGVGDPAGVFGCGVDCGLLIQATPRAPIAEMVATARATHGWLLPELLLDITFLFVLPQSEINESLSHEPRIGFKLHQN
jgi:hypothetical protein